MKLISDNSKYSGSSWGMSGYSHEQQLAHGLKAAYDCDSLTCIDKFTSLLQLVTSKDDKFEPHISGMERCSRLSQW
jgi:hypothetical protein